LARYKYNQTKNNELPVSKNKKKKKQKQISPENIEIIDVIILPASILLTFIEKI
jgi:hypothetical protein